MSSLNRTFLLILASITFILATAQDASVEATTRKLSSAEVEKSHKPNLQAYYCDYSYTYNYYGYVYCYYTYSGPNGGQIAGIVIGCIFLMIALISCCVKASRRQRHNALLRNQHLHQHHQADIVYNAAPVPTSAQKLIVVGGSEATNVPLAQPMIPANSNYGYGQPIYYANQQQYAAPSGIPDA